VRLLTAAGVVLAAIAFWGNVFPRAGSLIDDHNRDARLSREQALALPGRRWGAREDALAWADSVLPLNARVFLECPQPSPCTNALANWITYRLQPRVFTDYPNQAQWVLFYGTPTGALSSPRLTGVIEYAPGFAIARVAG
jgi:hypothetical protein